jgi:hypothetical protein
MTNFAPEFGSQIGAAYITASNNYLMPVVFGSAVVLVPWLAGGTSLLSRYSLTPNEVFLFCGFLGLAMELSLNPTALSLVCWSFVYGFLVYLPAHSLLHRPRPRTPKWCQYKLACTVSLACALPVLVADTTLPHLLGVRLRA